MTAANPQRALFLGDPAKPKKRKPVVLALRSPASDLRWLTVDPCSLELPTNPKGHLPRMGLAWRHGPDIIAAGSLGYSNAAGGEWHVRVCYPHDPASALVRFPSDFAAIRAVVREIPAFGPFPVRALFFERGFGANPKSVAEQGECRGMLRNAANEAGCEHVLAMSDGQWKRACGQHFGVTFPKKSAEAKIVGLRLARSLGFALGDKDTDISDAIMQSVAVPYLDLLPYHEPQEP